jgi:hypothetical protein
MGTRGPGGERDYALYAMLISPHGRRSLFIADRLPTLKQVNTAFAHVWQGLGHEQGYLLAEIVDPVFLVKSTGARLLDRLFGAIEPWLDGGAAPMAALGDILLAEEACSVTLELEGGLDLNWRRLSAEGFQPAFRRLGSHEPYDPRQLLKRQPRKGDAKGFR